MRKRQNGAVVEAISSVLFSPHSVICNPHVKPLLAMLILIAESKTMSDKQCNISPDELVDHTPLLETNADRIMKPWRALTAEEIAARLKLSIASARKIQELAYDFPNKSIGYRAIDAYTGVVFRQLDIPEMSKAEMEYCQNHVRILSSLYGYLRPEDIIKPYRLDFTLKESPEGTALYVYWRRFVTVALVRELQKQGITEILDLLPGDASKCVDWKLVKRYARVYKIDFKTPSGPDSMKTPNAGRLKELRGRLLSQILQDRPSQAAEAAKLESNDYSPQGELRYPGTFMFFTA